MSTDWFKHGFWNSLEHLAARGLDAFTTIAILWFVAPERFSLLALAQAYVAPILLFFVAPETALYPKFSAWSSEESSRLRRRLLLLRRFAWAKAVAALAFAATLALLAKSPVGTDFGYADRFFAFAWALYLPLAPQIAGVDREYLRLALRLRELNALTVLQRVLYFGGVVASSVFFDASFAALAASIAGASIVTAGIARCRVESAFPSISETEERDLRFWPLIGESLREFSFWNHLSGVVHGWVQTLDLFCLGLLGVPARQIGLYSVVLKIANFALAIPVALANLYLVRLGRAGNPDPIECSRERGELRRLSLQLGACAFGGSGVLWVLSPWALSLLSRGRWDLEDQARMVGWLGWILPGTALYASLLLLTGWLSLRRSFRDLVLKVYFPWAAVGFAMYAVAAGRGGPGATAGANIAVAGVLLALLINFSRLAR